MLQSWSKQERDKATDVCCRVGAWYLVPTLYPAPCTVFGLENPDASSNTPNPVKAASGVPCQSSSRIVRSRRALAITDTELRVIAALASIGLSINP